MTEKAAMKIPDNEKHVLSKSTFIRGLQCDKSLYLNRKQPRLRDATPPELRRIFDTGTEVGLRARDRFPGGVDAGPESPFNHQESLRRTKELIDQGVPVLYEAAFQHERVLSIMNILVNDGSGWRAYEVKSSTSVTDTYVMDASLQYHIINGSGLTLKDISIVYINNGYVRRGAIDPAELFTMESVHDMVLRNHDFVKNEIERMKGVHRKSAIPEIAIGEH
ncbi:MAG: hypothetical protein E4G96_02005 [Chrysiogenales bacterium]|nr:MAG: hypothetical protein E4G96_02005 [Chrysiogenales bacterium]